jgi:hypothetical protein
MRTNKFALSLAVAGLLAASTALAETDGAFVGVQLGYGGLKAKNEVSATEDIGQDALGGSKSMGAFRYGIMGGYKQFFTDNFGLRYYGVLDFGTDYKYDLDMEDETGAVSKQSMKISTWNINANVDALFNFVQNDSLDFGAFLGLSLGYASHTAKNAKLVDDGASGVTFGGDLKAGGFDLGINLGLKAQVAKNHGIELYSRFGVLQQKEEQSLYSGNVKVTNKFQQPYAVGLRYNFSF